MPKAPANDGESFVEMRFPKGGLDLSRAFSQQSPRPVLGEYCRTSPSGINVRTFPATSDRSRGGTRGGLAKFFPQPVVAGWIVQNLDLLVGSGYAAPGGGSLSSASGRVVTLVAGSQGNVYVANAGDTVWTSPTNSTGNTPPLIFTGRYFSAPNVSKLWFADGTNWVVYDPSINTLSTWAATAGSLPVDGSGNTPRLIETWRGRTFLSGLLKDQQNWFMSRVGVPTDFDYSPLSTGPADPVSGNDSPLGLIGDMVTGFAPFTDNLALCGGDHTLWMFSGDPQSGGSINLVSGAIGMAWGRAWCMDPYGTLYFVSNRCGVYSYTPGGLPQRISQAIEQEVQSIDTGANGIRLLWDDRYQGLHVFVTPLAAPGETTHFFFEQRTGGWWMDVFANPLHNPISCCVFDGNDPNDRAPLVGGYDGYVRTLSPTATDDDGTPIDSEVILGPILTADLDEMLLKDIQIALGATSGPVSYEILVGSTAEIALASTPFLTGAWTEPGRSLTSMVRAAGHAVYIRFTASNPWAMESLRARVAGQGKVRRRGA